MTLRDALHSIKFKIVAPVIGVVALAFVGASLVSWTLINNRIVAGSQQIMNVSASALQGAVVGSVWNYDSDQTLKALAPVAENPEFRLAVVLDSDGKPFAQLLGKGVADAAAAETISRLKATTPTAGAGFTEIRDADNLTRSYPLHHKEDGKDSVIGQLIFSSSTLGAAREARRTLLEFAGASLSVTLVLSLFLIGVVSRVSRPISAISASMHDLAHGNLTVEIEGRERRDEIGAMAKAVQVFKENAIERLQLERAATDARAAADAERERSAAEARRISAEQAQAVRSLADGLSRLASGDLTTRLEDGFPANYQRVRDDFNAAVDKLKATMLAIVASTDTISLGTQEVSSASDDLSRRTVHQASSLEETAAALGEITSTVRKSAAGAGQARQVVAAADENAKTSAVVVREAVSAMDAISKSAQEISQIIGVIDEIAFQTNLLALNAGVEAARAGEAGRGFAVVASEVRALAQRSAQAAKEIKALITASTTQVGRGVKLVAETGQSLERIVAQVSEINVVVAGIAAGADQQAVALAEVNSAIGQMDQMTQQNAAMVEETTAASRSLSQQIVELAALIAQFQVGSGSRTSTARLAA